MAVPSSSHHDREREREREREHRHRSERQHHHHRTISSTTLLLVLSLVLAVLAVMLSLPASQGPNGAIGKEDPAATGIWGYLNPKRSQVLVTRERDVAMRESEVARREAELLVGAPGGVLPNQSPVTCPVCPTQTVIDIPPAHTIIKEVVKEQELAPPGWWKEASARAEEILDRELRVADREREITRREESINKREHDASRREAWIMEQLVLINSDNAAVEEEVYYEQPGPKRKVKELPPIIVAETETKTVIQYETLPPLTVTVPPPANTRRAAFPTPDRGVSSSLSTAIPRTTAFTFEEEIVREPLNVNVEEIEEYEVEEYEEDDAPVPVRRNVKPGRRPPPPRSGWLW
ncbi:hypothetical protein EV363DRAFT_1319404 [Boletus edulis]|uniref:Uncharacterized protein n=1 Tax=Boletus edulis BED1 TaxID=1328754 RepID=A0AAD4C3T9_BOLED|nr:hypothetical protein EV363DRAFT_1319404 [Boletus edulis]KAF8447954.1 hypothetical protein L210DRAFT_3610132 [Boletus edulis BED1]